jgi:hypothetical protein
MADLVRLALSNVPTIMFAAALLIAGLRHDGRPPAARNLDWMLLLAVGVETLWAGLFHVLFPHIAARSIGWQVSPFQFEVGVADIAIGLVAIAAFWRSFAFKAAVVCTIVLFCIGVAIGHVREAVEAGNFAANNFGLLLGLTVVKIVLLPALLWSTWSDQGGDITRTPASRAR